MSLITFNKAKQQFAEHLKAQRLSYGYTQKSLSERSGVSLSVLRKFEQKGDISLESFIKLCMALDCLDRILEVLKPRETTFSSIDDVLKNKPKKQRQRGWKT